jgi:predicted MFS family arabinose efflux permease
MLHRSSMLTKHQQMILLIVLFMLHFSQILDFMIIMPLGPKLGCFFSISPLEFSFFVACYSFSAGLFGPISTFFIHRFDRKWVMLFCCAGLCLSSLFCASASSYSALVLGRIASGAFGGAIGTVIFSIIRDVISTERRKFFAASMTNAVLVVPTLGISLGLFLSNYYNWQIVFFGLSAITFFIFIGACFLLKPMRGYKAWSDDGKILRYFYQTAANSSHLKAFAFSAVLMFACFSVMPYISSYVVFNAGLNEDNLPYVFLIGGMIALFANKSIARICSKYNEEKVFYWTSIFSIFAILLITTLPKAPLIVIVIAASCFMIFIPGRLIPANAMITTKIDPRKQTAFSILNASLQGIATGFAALVGGALLTKGTQGALIGYDMVGGVAMLAALLAISFGRKLDSAIEEETETT